MMYGRLLGIGCVNSGTELVPFFDALQRHVELSLLAEEEERSVGSVVFFALVAFVIVIVIVIVVVIVVVIIGIEMVIIIIVLVSVVVIFTGSFAYKFFILWFFIVPDNLY